MMEEPKSRIIKPGEKRKIIILESPEDKEARAAEQLLTMDSFFDGLSPAMRRKMKRAARRIRGKRSIREIMGGGT